MNLGYSDWFSCARGVPRGLVSAITELTRSSFQLGDVRGIGDAR